MSQESRCQAPLRGKSSESSLLVDFFTAPASRRATVRRWTLSNQKLRIVAPSPHRTRFYVQCDCAGFR